ncbi:hypothetical protein M758_UG007600 [Ceratodon purpureus]|nr:hypothetical protein M758_UG007600 [Ceratodon purpureus]
MQKVLACKWKSRLLLISDGFINRRQGGLSSLALSTPSIREPDLCNGESAKSWSTYSTDASPSRQ